MNKVIRVNKLTKVFKTYQRGSSLGAVLKGMFIRKMIPVHAVKEISFDIEKGELVGFLGPNGAGKSTTIKILSGILFPSGGEVDILGYTPWKNRKKYVRHIGAVFGQKSQLLWDVPPLDAFYLNQAIYGIPDKEFHERMNELIKLLEVDEEVKKPTRQLSLGERMKCEFIMAMLHDPEIVFLDEPTIGLDVIAKERIREFITRMNEKGVTFILTTHDLQDIERLAKRVIVINHGEIIFDNTLETLKNHLGAKKTVIIASEKPIKDFAMNGVIVTQLMSDYDAEMKIDMNQTGISEFIDKVSAEYGIRDMIIQEIPIESIIKEMYQAKETGIGSADQHM